MQDLDSTSTFEPDVAAVFACSLSLWRACHRRARMEGLNLSDCYSGVDELMRVVMRVGYEFEAWACSHVDFDELGEVWPYFLDDNFGDACLKVVSPSAVNEWNRSACLRVAFALRLPIRPAAEATGPIDVHTPHPSSGAGFSGFRIQSVRQMAGDDSVEPFTYDDDPLDGRFGSPFFALYGIGDDGLLEHIADRDSFRAAVSLAEKIASGICFVRTQR